MKKVVFCITLLLLLTGCQTKPKISLKNETGKFPQREKSNYNDYLNVDYEKSDKSKWKISIDSEIGIKSGKKEMEVTIINLESGKEHKVYYDIEIVDSTTPVFVDNVNLIWAFNDAGGYIQTTGYVENNNKVTLDIEYFPNYDTHLELIKEILTLDDGVSGLMTVDNNDQLGEIFSIIEKGLNINQTFMITDDGGNVFELEVITKVNTDIKDILQNGLRKLATRYSSKETFEYVDVYRGLTDKHNETKFGTNLWYFSIYNEDLVYYNDQLSDLSGLFSFYNMVLQQDSPMGGFGFYPRQTYENYEEESSTQNNTKYLFESLFVYFNKDFKVTNVDVVYTSKSTYSHCGDTCGGPEGIDDNDIIIKKSVPLDEGLEEFYNKHIGEPFELIYKELVKFDIDIMNKDIDYIQDDYENHKQKYYNFLESVIK